MPSMNAFYAQSGGVTAVINATACGVIETARHHKVKINKLYAGYNGILGALHEELIDTSRLSAKDIAALLYTPGGAFGSCRYKLKDIDKNLAEYQRIMQVFSAHNIGYFFYNGGGDSQDTANKIAFLAKKMGYPLTCIGIPKTIDNDLAYTDNSPGFGSVAKYIAVSIKEAGLDIAAMAATSTQVFILEVMGRHTGWIAAAGGLAANKPSDPPHIILFPEIIFNQQKFLKQVQYSVKKYGYCAIVVSEGVKNADGKFLSEAGSRDAFGHTQLGGVAPTLAYMIKQNLGYKYHWAVADYLQRSARHIASQVDVEQAYAVGKAAVEFAMQGKNAIMPIIIRKPGPSYRWHIGEIPLTKVANKEKKLPRNYISANGFGITIACRNYLMPLIQGEAYPPYTQGLPQYAKFNPTFVAQKLKKPFNLFKS